VSRTGISVKNTKFIVITQCFQAQNARKTGIVKSLRYYSQRVMKLV